MGHEELKEIGINAYGHRHKLIKGIERLLGGQQGKGKTRDSGQSILQCICHLYLFVLYQLYFKSFQVFHSLSVLSLSFVFLVLIGLPFC